MAARQAKHAEVTSTVMATEFFTHDMVAAGGMKRARQWELPGLTVIGQSASSKPPPRVVQTCEKVEVKADQSGRADLRAQETPDSVSPSWRAGFVHNV